MRRRVVVAPPRGEGARGNREVPSPARRGPRGGNMVSPAGASFRRATEEELGIAMTGGGVREEVAA